MSKFFFKPDRADLGSSVWRGRYCEANNGQSPLLKSFSTGVWASIWFCAVPFRPVL